MTRAVHWTQNILEPCIPACGLSTFHRRVTSRNKNDVTCKRCLKLIGPSTIEPVERCPSVGPAPERFRCGLEAGHDGSHSALMETSAPWLSVERRAPVAASDSLRSPAQAVVDRCHELKAARVAAESFGNSDTDAAVESWGTVGALSRALDFAIGELSAALGKDTGGAR